MRREAETKVYQPLFSSRFYFLYYICDIFMFLPKSSQVKPQLFLILVWFSGFTKHPCCLFAGKFCPFSTPYAHFYLSLAVFIRCLSPVCCCLCGHIAHFVSGFASPVYSPWLHMLLHLLICSEPKYMDYILSNSSLLVSHISALPARRVTFTAAAVGCRDHPEMSPQSPEQFQFSS